MADKSLNELLTAMIKDEKATKNLLSTLISDDVIQAAQDAGIITSGGGIEALNAILLTLVNGLKTYSFGSNTPFTDDDTTKTYLDNISKDMPNVTAYRRAVNLNYVNQILGGGQFLIEGFKYNNDYEYQIARRYSALESITTLGRSKYKGVWPDKWTTLT